MEKWQQYRISKEMHTNWSGLPMQAFRKEQIFSLIPFPLNTIRNTPAPNYIRGVMYKGNFAFLAFRILPIPA